MTGPLVFRDGRDRTGGVLPVATHLRARAVERFAISLYGAVPVLSVRAVVNLSDGTAWPWYEVEVLPLHEALGLLVAGEA